VGKHLSVNVDQLEISRLSPEVHLNRKGHNHLGKGTNSGLVDSFFGTEDVF